MSEELNFKSIDNSTNLNNKDWSILSISFFKKIKPEIDLGCRYCLYRRIAYLDDKNKTYQIGSLYVPLNSFHNVWFFIRLMLPNLYGKGKTFGHFVSHYYSNSYKFKLINSSESPNQNNLLFASNSKIKVSERILFIPKKKMKFYVVEELEIS